MTFSTTLRTAAGWLLLALGLLAAPRPAAALQGANGAHDPSTIVKRNGVYHVWATGNQVYHITSTDLVNWTVAAPVFAPGTFPNWINSYVPGFQGFFWAPECVYRNGLYYLYYSCSLGGRQCAIGLTTSPDLNTWTDQGLVVASDNSSPWGSIDPAIFTDNAGRVWMAFGSHLSGIWLVELDPTTGKRLNTAITNIAGTSPWCDHEAAYVMPHGGYYYLYYNEGTCCAGTSSTYFVEVGRSASPTGPYLDKNGVNLLQGGGTPFMAARGAQIGPGHLGLYTEGGVNYLSYHYYDGTRGGAPTLGLTQLNWDAQGWPVAEPGWLPAGTYTLTGQGSGKAWAAANCTATAGQALVQRTPVAGSLCQQWQLQPQGGGVYTLKNLAANRYADVANCDETPGTALGLEASSPLNCQAFLLDRAASGSYVLAAYYGNRPVEVPGAAATDGAILKLGTFSAGAHQYWAVQAVGTATATHPALLHAALELYPNPAPGGRCTLRLPPGTRATLTVADLSGRLVHRQPLTSGNGPQELTATLAPGTYVVQVATATDMATRKLVVW